MKATMRNVKSNRNPLHDVPRHLFLPPVVKPGRSWLGVPGQILHIFERNSLTQQVGDRQFARFVLRDELGQFFTGSGWSDEPSGAALYYRQPDASEAHDRFYIQGDQPRETFTAKVIVTGQAVPFSAWFHR